MAMRVRPLTAVCVMTLIAVAVYGADPQPRSDAPVKIPVAELSSWQVEVFAGNAGGSFIEGPRRGCGAPGAMTFDRQGNAYVAVGSFVYTVTADGDVRLFAGVPGMPGAADGSAERACFSGINSIACGPDGAVYVSDAGNFCIKKIVKGEDGAWQVLTVAGTPGVRGRKDGEGRNALLGRPEGLAFDSKGNLYTMDQDWLLRISKDGMVTNLNPLGGTGAPGDGPLESAKFNRLMGSGAISMDGDDNLYQADLWNNRLRKIDLKTGIVSTIAGGGGEPWKSGMPFSVDGDALKEARFHGVNGAMYDSTTKRIYTKAVDEAWVRCLSLKDGRMESLGPMKESKLALREGPLEGASAGYMSLLGVDFSGRVYAGHGGYIYRFYNSSVISGVVSGEKEKKEIVHRAVPAKHVAPGVSTATDLRDASGSVTGSVFGVSAPSVLVVADAIYRPSVIASGTNYIVLWQEGGRRASCYAALLGASGVLKWRTEISAMNGGGISPAGVYAASNAVCMVAWSRRESSGDRIVGTAFPLSDVPPVADADKCVELAAGGHCRNAALATDGYRFLLVWHELSAGPDLLPQYAVKARLFDVSLKPASAVIFVAPLGSSSVAGFDGSQFFIAYEAGGSIYVRRISAGGELVDKDEAIKLGGQWGSCPGIASDGRRIVVTGARRPWPNPWGWNGPGAISIGTVTGEGKTPERFGLSSDEVADGGFAGLLDSAKWKGRKGWPAGIPGGLKETENGYWPHLYSAVAWDGRSWVTAWVRSRMGDRMSGLNLTDRDIFACRVDAVTMMPVNVPLPAAGGVPEPGMQTLPSIASCGDGRSLLVYLCGQADGSAQLRARFAGGGAHAGTVRVEPRAGKK